MKILSVRLKNINSLKGEHFIPFNQSPFTDSGLFAITGPTGAGKSSILDAITLALYGWAPRFNRDNPFELMSYHTADCLAEVEFSVKEKVYRSKWSIHRSRGKLDGEIQQPKMELIDVQKEVILESKKTEVIAKVTEITGLDYFRFLRSVMLAQGDFAAFLKADEKTRGELLEKITGTAVYTQLSRRAFEKQKEKKQGLEKLESLVDISRLIAPEQVEQYQQQILLNKQRVQTLTKELEKLAMQMQWLETMEKLRKKAIHLKLELEQVQGLKNNHQKEFEKYHLHLQTLPLQPLHREIEVGEASCTQLLAEIEQIQSIIPSLVSSKEKQTSQVLTAGENLAQAKLLWENMVPILEQTTDLDKTLVSLQEKYKTQKNEYTQVHNELLSLQEQVASCQKSLAYYGQKQSSLKKYLQLHKQDACLETELGLMEQHLTTLFAITEEMAIKQQEQQSLQQESQDYSRHIHTIEESLKENTTVCRWKESQLKDIDLSIKQLLVNREVEEIEQTLLNLNRQYVYRQNQLTTAKEYVEKNDKLLLLQKEIPQNEQAVKEHQAKLAALKTQEAQTQLHVETLQRLYESETLILNYESSRQQLVSGEACPLCGSLYHPFVKEHHTIELSKTAQQRDAQKKVLEDFRFQIEQATRDLSITQANQTTYLKDLKNLSLEVSNLEKIFEAQNQQLGENNHIDQLSLLAQKLNENTADQQHLQQLLNTYKEKNKIRTQYHEEYETIKQAVQQNEKQLGQQRLKHDHTQSNLRKLQKDIALIQDKINSQHSTLHHMLASYALDMPSKEIYPSWLRELRNRSIAYQQYIQQEKEVIEQIHIIQLELEKNNSLLIKTEQQTYKLKEEIAFLEKQGKTLREERIKLFGDKNVAEEKDRLSSLTKYYEAQLKQEEKELNYLQEQLSVKKQQLADKDISLERNKQNLAVQRVHFQAELQRTGFSDLVHFSSSILDRVTETAIKHQKDTIEEKMTGLKGAINHNELELKEQGAKELTEAGIDELKQLYEISQHEKEELIGQTARVEQMLIENEELIARHKDITEAIEKYRKEYEKWKILSDMIGSATGAEFNIFAQGLTLARLVFLANRFLEKLNPRYQIRRKPHTDLDLEIIDRYQADNVRSMKTLSGGETFLVSLALALGLSDLAGNKTRIDSLFIDEGFGTLDPQALDIAITTLENLQATGKMIGIISHVDALKERITTQIHVTRQASGISKIHIIS